MTPDTVTHYYLVLRHLLFVIFKSEGQSNDVYSGGKEGGVVSAESWDEEYGTKC